MYIVLNQMDGLYSPGVCRLVKSGAAAGLKVDF
jgi:hypothetical protein